MRIAMSRKTQITLALAALAAFSWISNVNPAFASSGGGGLPWESPLQQIQQSITGPVAGFIALAAVAIAGAMLIFGGELNDFARRLCYVALVGGVLLGATQIVALFGATGASIGEVEIMLNPDGKLFIERLGHGVAPAGLLSPAAAEVIIGSVAHALQSEADDEQPIISGELPIGGHRFEGLLPPVVSGPSFTIRRRASRLIPLDDYVKHKIMTAAQVSVLRSAIASRMNIVISGGTGSGKTTLANAVIAEIVANAPDDRIVILEDTAEIQCAAENAVALHTSDTIDMARLLKSTMRLRPDRIIVGEVRDGAALTLLKAWNTGHPGGVTTIHSNTAMSALRRLEQLTAEVSQQPMQEVIGEAVDLIVSIERTGKGRRVREVIHVEGFANARYRTEHYAQIDEDSHVA
uniref:P-type conjugative transfer ATPase TrbB n=2 Tax=Agrobacterium deltaense TaxID=1183412 RepID=A0A2Z2PZV6_9HYPH|nr:P-type conjugative transfer ATPase TrbB [Agrobacterium deltaense]